MALPPKMRLPYAPSTLTLVPSTPVVEQAPREEREPLYRGVVYPWEKLVQWVPKEQLADATEALLARFHPGANCSRIESARKGEPFFLWDVQRFAERHTAENQLELQSSAVDELAVEKGVDGHWLSIVPRFTFSYQTAAYAAQLGEIRLVSSTRFITNVDGSRHDLLNTDAFADPVLYRERDDGWGDDSAVVRQITSWQSVNTGAEYCFDYRISQYLPVRWLGCDVQSVTVLEQYTSYFMQRPLAAAATVWVPAYAPISWGWSLRVEPEEGEWVITRRKLIRPTVGHDGWQLPQWRASTLDCIGKDFSAGVET